MFHIVHHKRLLIFIIVYFFSYCNIIWHGLQQKALSGITLYGVIPDWGRVQLQRRVELYTGIKISLFGIHSWMDLEKLSQLTEFKGILTYANTQTFFFFKGRCLVTNSVGRINLSLLDIHCVTLFGHCITTLTFFYLYGMK